MDDDRQLLREYATKGSETAFAGLVQRHVNFVYSAALRQLNGDAHLAADATQLVFSDLARKAGSLLQHRVLAALLFTSTRYATAKLVRTERRRQAREAKSQLMEQLNHDASAPVDWPRVRPVLDEVLGELSESDREAILLRFFEGRDYASVGAKLNLTDNTVRMRVDRALEKLRRLLERRGVKSTVSALGLALADQAVVAAPAGLAASVSGSAFLSGGAAAASGGVLTTVLAGAGSLPAAVAVVLLGGAGVVWHQQENAALRAELAALRGNAPSIGALRSEHARLAATAAEVAMLRRDDAELANLRDEAAALQAAMREAATPARTEATSVTGTIFDLQQLDQTPQARFQSSPQYPPEMRAAGIKGEVVVDFVVDVNGDVQNAFALRSSRPEFEAAAVHAVQKWRFIPGQRDSKAVNTHLQIPIVFTLGEGQSKLADWF